MAGWRGEPREPGLDLMASDGALRPLPAAVLSLGVIALTGALALVVPNVRNSVGTAVWYRRLDKPPLTPPDPVFGIAWPIIQAAMAYAGYRLLKTRPTVRRNAALGLLAFNASQIPTYSGLFFGLRSITGGLISAVALASGAWAFVGTAWNAERRAALAGLPLAGWTSFAVYLQASIWWRNAHLSARLKDAR